MAAKNGSRLEISGAMTVAGARVQLDAGKASLAGGVGVIDLAAVTEVDSSGLAVIFAWQREAQRLKISLRVENLPAELVSLAGVYGVADFLPAA